MTRNRVLRPAAGRYYRSVTSERPTDDEFRSHQELGPRLPPDASEDLRRRWTGVSVFLTAAQARANRERDRRGRIGDWIAELDIPEGTPIVHEGPDHKGHCDLYNAPAHVLRGYVRSIVHYTAVPRPGHLGR